MSGGSDKILKVATVFSGIGAFEEALKQLNIPHEILFACDNGERYLKQTYEDIIEATKDMTKAEREKYVDELYEKTGKENNVKKSYFANYEITEDRWHNDIRFLDGEMYKGKVDILVGGSPCQSFSVMGKRKGLEEARGTLFYDYARIVKEVKPKVFIFENVKGILNHDKGNTWAVISKIFDELGYNWKLYVLNAKNYGLPQNRLRIFVIGYHKQYHKEFNDLRIPEPQPLTKCVEDYLERQVDNKYYLPQKGFERAINPKEKKHVALNGKIARCQVACQQYNWFGDLRFETNVSEKILNDTRIFKGFYNGKFGVTRCLTPRECLRLMGFSDNFKQAVCDVQMYRQVGNSISVNVLKTIIDSIFSTSIFGSIK